MKILALDTSTRNFSLAVADGARTISYKNIKLGRSLSNRIMPTIEQLLKRADLSLENIDGIAVGLGPGYFTSLRIGLSTVKGLSFALKKPVVGINSLDVIAHGLNGYDQINVICDAKRSLVYTAGYKRDGQRLKQAGEYRLTDIAQALKGVGKSSCVAGDGIDVYKAQIVKTKAAVADKKLWHPQAKVLASLAAKRFECNKQDDVQKLTPLYLYAEDCQVRA